MLIANHNLKEKVLIIAELSANHGQSKDLAIKTIRAAKQAGADAIKLQTYTPDVLTINCDLDCFKISGGLWDGRTLYDLYKEAFTPLEWHYDLFRVAKEEGLICFSSPFDNNMVDFLETFNPPAYKIASFEIQDIPFIQYTASKGRPIIISTGIADYDDIDLAVKTCRNVGNNNIILLKCTSAYPAPIDEANLVMIEKLKKDFDVEVGLSDHTAGIVAPIVAVSLGARVVEKHFIIDRSTGGPDASFSLDLGEFSAMVKAVRDAEMALGSYGYEISSKVKDNKVFGRSLFAVEDIQNGEIISENNIRSIRPGYGLHPKYYFEILGKKVNCSIQRGTPLSKEMFDW